MDTRPKVDDDLLEAYYRNAAVFYALNQWRNGLCSKEQALKTAVLMLYDESSELAKQLYEIHAKGLVPMIIKP